jgi:GNAT superfamily N-acetyltransferase
MRLMTRRGGYLITHDASMVDLDLTWRFLRRSYWSPNIPRDVVAGAISGSLVAGLYDERSFGQAGFARAVTDGATFAWIADVFVVEAHRGRGLGSWLVKTLLSHPDLQGLRTIALATADAHDFYRRLGFETIDATIFMSIRRSPEELYGT